MSDKSYDLAVIGLGAVGGSALLTAARAGARVVGFDRFSPPHIMGSTHGETRIVRAAIGEGTVYTPFALRSFELMHQLEHETGDTLLNRCGLLVLGGGLPHATHVPVGFLDTTIEAARTYSIPHELLPASEVRKRFPAYETFDGKQAYYEPGAGMAFPERVVAAQIVRARALKAKVKLDTQVIAVEPDGSGLSVRTSAGSWKVRRAVVCAGAWVPHFLPAAMARTLSVSRQSLHWFQPPAEASAFMPERMPVFIWNDLYGFPIAAAGGGVKIATETLTDVVDPDATRIPVTQRDIDILSPRVRTTFPGLGRHLQGATCLYTSTPDHHFAIVAHPEIEGVTVASACSGHGFKHAAGIGEAVACEALGIMATPIPESWRRIAPG
jgi:sarcosine oxidase